jgi:hypothetical protein
MENPWKIDPSASASMAGTEGPEKNGGKVTPDVVTAALRRSRNVRVRVFRGEAQTVSGVVPGR